MQQLEWTLFCGAEFLVRKIVATPEKCSIMLLT
jgi:hypothetical protein